MVLDDVWQHTPNLVMIDDFWIRVKKRYPTLTEFLDRGYQFGYRGARWDDTGDQQRTDRFFGLVDELLRG